MTLVNRYYIPGVLYNAVFDHNNEVLNVRNAFV